MFRRRVPALRIAAGLGPSCIVDETRVGQPWVTFPWPQPGRALQIPTIGQDYPARLQKICFGKSHRRGSS
jgi:hypothetical protein